MASCRQCGNNFPDTCSFCPNCGIKLEATPITPPPVMDLEQTQRVRPPQQENQNYRVTDSVPPVQQYEVREKKKRPWLVVLIILLLLLLLGGAAFAAYYFGLLDKLLGNEDSTSGDASLDGAAVTFSEFNVDEKYFLCGKKSEATFTVKAESTSENLEVNLVNGEEIVAKMTDDGQNGDKTAGDGIYTCTVSETVTSSTDVTKEYKANSADVYSDVIKLYFISKAGLEQAKNDINAADVKLATLEESFNANGTEEEKTESAKTVYDNVVNYFNELTEKGTVTEYTQEEDTIVAVFHGVSYVYVFDLEKETENGGSSASTEDGSSIFGNKKVISIQPYATELNTTVFDDAATATGELFGHEFVSDVNDGDVTVEFMKSLDQYDVIIWDGHGGNSSRLHSFVGIGEDSSNFELYLEDAVGSTPGIVCLSSGRLGVTPYFFENHYEEGDFDGALVFMAGCRTADDDYLANAFLDRGAEAYFGYKHSVYINYNRDMTEAVFKSLTSLESNELGTYTVSAALESAKSEIGATDTTIKRNWWYKLRVLLGWIEEAGEPAELVVLGDTNHRLVTPIGALAGKVCKASDRVTPIENAKIDVYAGESIYTTLYSDAEGNYTATLPVGEYALGISAEGYMNFVCYTKTDGYVCTYTETFLMVVGTPDTLGIAAGTISHALTGVGEAGVTIEVYKDWNNQGTTEKISTVKTSASGTYSLELPLGNYTVKAYKDGFVDCYFNIIVQDGITENQNGTINPTVSGDDFLITLTWDSTPEDLDSHVRGQLSDGSEFHVDYHYSENRDYTANFTVLDPPVDGDTVVCRLDCDDINSYGPEHITLSTTTDKPYYYYIYNFSNESSLTYSGARVTIHQGNNLIADFHVPTNQTSGRYWNVFAIVDGEIVVENTITSSADLDYAG